jgi:hypothetical protein
MKFPWKPKRFLVKIIKVLGWIILSVILMLVALSVAIQIPAVQNAIVQKAVTFLHSKIGTEVRLAHVSLSFPKKVVLEGLYLEDQQQDTLLYIGELAVDTDLWGLTRNTIELNDVEIDTLRAYISRTEHDSTFNFDYIIKAFTSADTTTIKDTTATPWEFSIEDIALHQTRFAFHDSLTKNDIQLRSGELSISMDEFDLAKSIIHADEIALENVTAVVVQRPAAAPRPDSTTSVLPDTTSIPFDLGVNTIRLKSIKALYTNATDAQRIELVLGNAQLDADEINLQKQIVRLNEFTLEKTFIGYHQMANVAPGAQPKETNTKKTPKNQVVQDTSISATPWTISLGELNLTDNSIQYYDFNQPVVKDAIDFNHLWITGFSMQAEDLTMKGIDIAGKLEDLTLQDKSGFTISSFKTDFALTDKVLRVKELHFNTPNTTLNLDAEATFPSLAKLAEQYADATVDMNIAPSSLSMRDVLYLAPALLDSIPLTLTKDTRVDVEVIANGKLKDFTLERLSLRTLSQTSLEANGTIKGLPDAQHAALNISLKKFYTTAKDIDYILPDTMLPSSIALPRWINLAGTVKGTPNAPDTKAVLTSDFGTINLRAAMNFDSTAAENYDAQVTMNKFKLGKLLKQEQAMGTISLQASAKGAGFAMKDINAAIKLTIQEFLYNNYTYKNFIVDGSFKKYFFSGIAKLDDKNLNFKLKGDLDYHEDIPRYDFKLDLANADFRALNLSERRPCHG